MERSGIERAHCGRLEGRMPRIVMTKYKIKVNNVNNLTIKTQIKRLIKNAQIYLQGVTFRNFVSYNVPIRNDMNYKEGLIYET